MMERLKKAISKLDKRSLIERLRHSNYAFACWKLPNSSSTQMIVSLETSAHETSDLSDLGQGFVFNTFSDSHPTKPHYIKADLIFNEELDIDPCLNAAALEAFEEVILNKTESDKPADLTGKGLSEESFERLVSEAINQISGGDFEKVVLSRFKDVHLPSDFSSYDFFELLSHNYEQAFCSLVYIPGNGTWIGATPELLLSDDSKRFKTIALAGTKKLIEGQPLSEIAWTQKEIEEQAFVSRYIINCFKKLRLREFHEHGPKTIRAANLAHLKTEFEVHYDEMPFDKLADQMLELLHPTSAVCGMPLEPSKAFIAENETYDRSFYAGFLGPVHFNGSTDLFVNLRCMVVSGDEARLFAGAGITEDSIPENEFNETELKLDTLMSLIKD